jgi:hypothetical protein
MPAVAVVALIVWVSLHTRLEAGLGDVLLHRWRRAWRPGLLPIALLSASLLVFALTDARGEAKVLPLALGAVALSTILFGGWWRGVVSRGRRGDPVRSGLPGPAGSIELRALTKKGEGS